MQIFQISFYFSALIYSFFYDSKFIQIYLTIIGLYFICSFLVPSNKFNTLRKKIQIASWDPPQGPIINQFQLDATNVINYLNSFPQEQKITITHFVAKVFALIYEKCPDLNGKISFGKFVPYPDVNICLLCDVNNGEDLAAILIEKCNQKSLTQVQEIVQARALKIKSKKDDIQKKRTGAFKYLPPAIIALAIQATNFVIYTLGIPVSFLGAEKYPFGSCVITSVGSLGAINATGPHNKVSLVSSLVTLNKVHKAPWVVDDKILVRDIVNINVQTDHRFIDGGKGKIISFLIKDCFENPQKYFQ